MLRVGDFVNITVSDDDGDTWNHYGMVMKIDFEEQKLELLLDDGPEDFYMNGYDEQIEFITIETFKYPRNPWK